MGERHMALAICLHVKYTSSDADTSALAFLDHEVRTESQLATTYDYLRGRSCYLLPYFTKPNELRNLVECLSSTFGASTILITTYCRALWLGTNLSLHYSGAFSLYICIITYTRLWSGLLQGLHQCSRFPFPGFQGRAAPSHSGCCQSALKDVL